MSVRHILYVLFLAILTATARTQPNVIYIMADDLGYGDLSCYGQRHFTTPNIDRLATEGIKFTAHYSGSTVCAPSRCSLMTGLHTGNCFVRGNKEIRPVGQHPMPADTLTVAEVFKKQGYATGAFGKWGLGSPGSEGDPIHQGFDRFYGYNCQRNAHTFYPKWLYDDLEQVKLDGKTYSHDLIADQALKWIREQKDTPFFCYLPITIPHAAMHVPEEYTAPFRKQFAEYENVIGRYSGPQVKNPVAAFAGMMVKFDETIGELLDLLEELGIDENTIVMFTSDNGPHKEGGHRPEVFDSNGPLKGLKRDLTEGGIRVPFMARWPGKIKPGTTTEHLAGFWDFLPTCCDLIGAEVPAGLDGISYLPALLGKERDQKKHEYLYWEFFERGGKRAVRFGKWKAIQVNVHKDANGPIQLFDLDKDLGETTDLAAKFPEVLDRAKKYFADAHSPSEIWAFKSLGE